MPKLSGTELREKVQNDEDVRIKSSLLVLYYQCRTKNFKLMLIPNLSGVFCKAD
jgi:hypothetical protein